MSLNDSNNHLQIISNNNLEINNYTKMSSDNVSSNHTVVSTTDDRNRPLDLDFLTPDERDAILAVLARDENLQRKEEERLDQLKKEIRELRAQEFSRISFDANKICGRCLQEFGWLFNRGQVCSKCRLRVCKKCRQLLNSRTWLCLVCLKVLELESQTGNWFYSRYPKNKKNKSSSQVVTAIDILRISLGDNQSSDPDDTPLLIGQFRNHVTSMTHLPEEHKSCDDDDDDEEVFSDSDSLFSKYLSASTPNLAAKASGKLQANDRGSLTNLYIVDTSELREELRPLSTEPNSEHPSDDVFATEKLNNSSNYELPGLSAAEQEYNETILIIAQDRKIIAYTENRSSSVQDDGGVVDSASDNDDKKQSEPHGTNGLFLMENFSDNSLTVADKSPVIENQLHSSLEVKTSEIDFQTLNLSSSTDKEVSSSSSPVQYFNNQPKELLGNDNNFSDNFSISHSAIPTTSNDSSPPLAATSDPVRLKVSALLAKYGRSEMTSPPSKTELLNKNVEVATTFDDSKEVQRVNVEEGDDDDDDDDAQSPTAIEESIRSGFSTFILPNSHSIQTFPLPEDHSTCQNDDSPNENIHQSLSINGNSLDNEDDDNPLERFLKNEALLEKQRQNEEEEEDIKPMSVTIPWQSGGSYDLDWDAEDDGHFFKDYDTVPTGFLDDEDDDDESKGTYSELRSMISNILHQSEPSREEEEEEEEEQEKYGIPMLRKRSLSVISEHTEPSPCSSYGESSLTENYPDKDDNLSQKDNYLDKDDNLSQKDNYLDKDDNLSQKENYLDKDDNLSQKDDNLSKKDDNLSQRDDNLSQKDDNLSQNSSLQHYELS